MDHNWQQAATLPQHSTITKERISTFLQGFPEVFRSDASRIPVTYPITLWQDVKLPWLPGDHDGKTIIHGQQTLHYFRTFLYNEKIIWQIHLASIRETKGSQGKMQLLDCVMDVKNAHAETILQANTTLLLLDQPRPSPQPKSKSHSQSHTNLVRSMTAGRISPPELYGLWDKKSLLIPGAVLIDACLGTITEDMLIAYAAASGDHNAIHLDLQKALEFGLPGRVAHGMLVLGMVGNLLQELQTGHMTLRSLECRFRIPIVEGDTVFSKVIVQSVVTSQCADKGASSSEEAAARNNPGVYCLLEVFIVRPQPDSSNSESHLYAATAHSSGNSQRILAYSGSAVYVFV
ncbi:hypothetical protein YSY43_40040 [Paenibacillus sp. YSY-4.3]